MTFQSLARTFLPSACSIVAAGVFVATAVPATDPSKRTLQGISVNSLLSIFSLSTISPHLEKHFVPQEKKKPKSGRQLLLLFFVAWLRL